MSAAHPNPLRKLLVVDDDETFRTILSQILKSQGCEVTQADSVANAKSLLELQLYHAMISDIRMPGESGIALLKHARGKFPEMPVVLMTGFQTLEDTQEAHRAGAGWFLPKPFSQADILEVLRKLLDKPSPAAATRRISVEREYAAIPIEEFVSGREFKHDVFIRLSADKFVKIAHRGEDVPPDRISGYLGKGIRHLFLKKADFHAYARSALGLAPIVRASHRLSDDKKVAFLKHAATTALKSTFLDGGSRELFDEASEIVLATVELVADESNLIQILSRMGEEKDPLFAHSLGVSAYSTMIAQALGWKSLATLHKLALGGLLHDLGLREIAREIREKPRALRGPEETKAYRTHPALGVEVLMRVKGVPNDVLSIVHQHHESCAGDGFPNRLLRLHIHPLARVVCVADEFCDLAIPGPSCPEGMSAGEALERMALIAADKFDPGAYGALRSVFRLPGVERTAAG